ncbi:MAG: hypothetical protein U1C53_00965 [Candidatus Veblenbacteria bacterium]|nr:hypothetical protein [Candidatus Veblenbacteria bacterium]
MYGAVLIILSLTTSNLTLYAIGLGLLVDELPQVVTGAWRWEDYYSAKYGLGMVALIVVIYLLRDHLVPIS